MPWKSPSLLHISPLNGRPCQWKILTIHSSLSLFGIVDCDGLPTHRLRRFSVPDGLDGRSHLHVTSQAPSLLSSLMLLSLLTLGPQTVINARYVVVARIQNESDPNWSCHSLIDLSMEYNLNAMWVFPFFLSQPQIFSMQGLSFLGCRDSECCSWQEASLFRV